MRDLLLRTVRATLKLEISTTNVEQKMTQRMDAKKAI